MQLQELAGQTTASREMHENMLSRHRKAQAADIGRTMTRVVTGRDEPLAPDTPGSVP